MKSIQNCVKRPWAWLRGNRGTYENKNNHGFVLNVTPRQWFFVRPNSETCLQILNALYPKPTK